VSAMRAVRRVRRVGGRGFRGFGEEPFLQGAPFGATGQAGRLSIMSIWNI